VLIQRHGCSDQLIEEIPMLRTYAVRLTGALLGLAAFMLCPSSAYGQADLIGSRGGLTAPTPISPPVLPPNLNLPPLATDSLLNGLNASGSALRPGMGWLVSDLAQQGIRGPQLADIIQQLKPYKQRGVLTFPQPGGLLPGMGGGGPGQFIPKINRGFGKGGGKGGKG
jgi:hypothetical protein